MTQVNLPRLRQELGWWLDAQEGREVTLARVALDAGTTVRTLRRLLAGDAVSIDLAERILLAIDYQEGPRRHPRTGRLLPRVIRSSYELDGRARQPGETGRIRTVDFANAKLSERQLRALYRLHIDGGLSLRELCRRGWQAWGYASERSALSSICDRLHSIGLEPRPRAEATALANRQRPGVEKPAEMTKNEWRRLKRAHLRRTDLVFRADELARIAGLRAREQRQREAASG